MKTVYERLDELKAGNSVFVDLHNTLMLRHTGNGVNRTLIDALIYARTRGIIVCLWTGGNRRQTSYGLDLMRKHGLVFDYVFYNILKPDGLIIDNLGVSL